MTGATEFWNDERVAILKSLWSTDGPSASAIAAELGCATRNAVIGKAKRLGLPPRPNGWEKSDTPRPSRKRGKPARTWNGTLSPPELPTEPEIAPDVYDQAIPQAQRRTLLQLEEGQCRWPVGHPRAPDFFFCGAAALPERPYCAAHCRRAYQPPPVRAPRAYIPMRRETV